MRRVCIVSGGITKFAKANLDTQEAMCKDALDYAMNDLGGRLELKDISSTMCTYFSDHFQGQLSSHVPQALDAHRRRRCHWGARYQGWLHGCRIWVVGCVPGLRL